MLSPNTILQNRYRVVRELGHGGMGTVYEAIDQRVNSIVALKETLATSDDDARRAFEREAALLANLRHQALPKVMDYFSEKDCDFLVMEFIPGHDLAELLELRTSPFAQTEVLRWADELLKVLEYLHGQHPPILHRDIKPSNLKLTRQGEVFLLDFGLAKGSVGQMSTVETNRSVRGYTPVYASLEQIHGHGTDERSDLYSLGATLYHLLTGTPPIDAPARFHAIEDGQTDPLLPIQKLNSAASANVAGTIHQAMALSRKHRPNSAAEMRKLLVSAVSENEKSADRVSVFGISTAPDSQSKEADAQSWKTPSEQPASLPTTMPPPTQEWQSPMIVGSESRRAVTTMPGLRPDQLRTRRNSAELSADELARAKRTAWKRAVVATAIVSMILVAAGLVIWSRRRATIQNLFVSNPIKSVTNASSKTRDRDPKRTGLPSPPGMAYVPGGVFMMGRDNGDDAERPLHQVSVQPFYIDVYEVTNEDYEKFVKATTHRPPPNWKNGSFPSDWSRKPVTGMAWADANDYARWAGKRLPTEEEWEFAARGPEDSVYPWGNDWQQGAANANGAEQSMADIGAYKGASPFGTYDMVGNAWEWTASSFKPYPGRGLPANLSSADLRVIRGGCYQSTKDYATTTYRAGWPARGAPTYEQTGFRCAKDVGP